MSKYITTIGLEIHAELLTKSKVFCTCSAEFGGEPNTRCCPVCSGLPGTLPILNHTAVEYIVKAGYTMDCKISRFTKWDRKNYFYPDLPKAYQISQMPRPVCLDGRVPITVNGEEKVIRINRIHLEEDAGKLVHDDRARVSLADYNRCGIPLIEIVTEPDFHSADDVTAFIEKIRLLLQYAEVCDCKMEQGSMRCDVNISIAPEGAPLGTRAEIKNLNSVRAIGRAIEYEVYRQGALLDAGEKVLQETRRFNDASGETSTLRSKEDAHDYRYFPDPDIPPIVFTEEELEAIRASLPEMPEKRYARYTGEYGIAKNEADTIIASKPVCDFFEDAISVYANPKAVSAFILVELMRRINLGEADMATLKITGAMFGRLVEIGYTNKISKDKMKDVLRVMLDTGKTADEVADSENLWIKEDLGLVEKTIGDILSRNAQAVEQFKAGEQKVFGFLMGQASKALKGSAAPQVIKEMLECMLNGTTYVKQTAEEITAKIADEKQAKKQQTAPKETVNAAPAVPAERSVLDSIKGSSDTNRKKDVMFMPNRYRDHNTSMISEAEIGKTIRVSGWVENIRDHGGIKFIDLRDHYGVVQITMQQNEALLDGVNKECAISVEGKLVKRAADTFNDRISTGTVELVAEKLDILGKVTTPLPFEVPSSKETGEDIRLKYRFLDMRNKKVHDNIVFRSKVLSFMRERMTEMNFLELQTPILSTSSPEGARDYLIPSRKHHGKFYALPQAPQIFKQLYMVSGFDRYFQLAPCFRDEDARADRTPGEFYQLDMEMSFATQEDVFAVAENVFPAIIEKFTDKPFTKGPFPRITFDEAMLKYGSDKPDLRNPLFIIELSDLFVNSDFKPFANKTVRGIRVPKMAEKSKSFFENMEKYALSIGMKGLGYVKVDADGKYLGPIDKFLTDEAREEIRTRAELIAGDVLYFIADAKKAAEKFAGQIRTEVANRMDLIKNDRFEICWIVDFPMYEEDEETGKPIFTHNPFSMPQGELEALNTKNPCDVLAYQYDVVCNGVELASGAVRNHDIDVMVKAFDIAGYTEADVAAKFGALYSAFKFGAPPHAGMAFGIDRMIMLLLDEESIREVIAFPLNSNAQDLLLGAPTEVTEQQLRDVHIKVRTRPQDVKTEQK